MKKSTRSAVPKELRLTEELRITATQARGIALNQVEGPLLLPYLKRVYIAIRRAASAGDFYVQNPHLSREGDPPLPPASSQIEEKLWERLKADGFVIETKEDREPYIEVYWT